MTATLPENANSPSRAHFHALFALAHIGAFAACLPLLTMLVPLKATEIAASNSAAILSWTILIGAGTASVTNIAGGIFSDKTRSRYGRRRPWILGGSAGTALSYFFIWRATSATELIIGVVFFQIAFNLLLPALIALLPDEVPNRSKGRMASLLALGPPIGLGIGAGLAGAESISLSQKYIGLVCLSAALIAPLLIFWKEPPTDQADFELSDKIPTRNRSLQNYWRVWNSRLFTQIGIATSQGFILLFIANAISASSSFPSAPAENLAGWMIILSTSTSIITALAVGIASDHFGDRRLYVAASGGFICAGMAVIAGYPVWGAVLVGQFLYGIGVGLYSSAEVALAAELLPSRRNSARDLAILNLGNTVPQIVAPTAALLMINTTQNGYSLLFAAGAFSAFIGGAIALRIRSDQ